jgi:hypothetical protein
LTSSGDAGPVGSQQAAAPDPKGMPLELNISYPNNVPAMPRPVALFQQVVAADAPISSSWLALIVISHGTGGGGDTHYDTALARAEAGFIVAAMTHTATIGATARTASSRGTSSNGPATSASRSTTCCPPSPATAISSRARIGPFGHSDLPCSWRSAALPEFARVIAFCHDQLDDRGCRRRHKEGWSRDPGSGPAEVIWVHDARIATAVNAPPSAG